MVWARGGAVVEHPLLCTLFWKLCCCIRIWGSRIFSPIQKMQSFVFTHVDTPDRIPVMSGLHCMWKGLRTDWSHLFTNKAFVSFLLVLLFCLLLFQPHATADKPYHSIAFVQCIFLCWANRRDKWPLQHWTTHIESTLFNHHTFTSLSLICKAQTARKKTDITCIIWVLFFRFCW